VKRPVLILIFFAVFLSSAFAHPHVFMETRIEVAYNNEGLQGFWITWKFDRAFTAGILMDFDADRNERLSPAEVAAVEQGAFSNLVNYNYFVYIRSAKGQFRPTYVREFTAYVEDHSLHYRFFVPYSLPIHSNEVKLNIAVYDETFFCDIGYAEAKPLQLSDSEIFHGEYAIRQDRGIHIDYTTNDGSRGSTFPLQVVLILRRAG